MTKALMNLRVSSSLTFLFQKIACGDSRLAHHLFWEREIQRRRKIINQKLVQNIDRYYIIVSKSVNITLKYQSAIFFKPTELQVFTFLGLKRKLKMNCQRYSYGKAGRIQYFFFFNIQVNTYCQLFSKFRLRLLKFLSCLPHTTLEL